jgi:hypothetical protein
MPPEMRPRQQNTGSTPKQMAMLLIPQCLIHCICYVFLIWAWQGVEKAVGRIVNPHLYEYTVLLF